VLDPQSRDFYPYTLSGLAAYLVSFAIGMAPLPWTINPVIFTLYTLSGLAAYLVSFAIGIAPLLDHQPHDFYPSYIVRTGCLPCLLCYWDGTPALDHQLRDFPHVGAVYRHLYYNRLGHRNLKAPIYGSSFRENKPKI
jgi:hypothetical protein